MDTHISFLTQMQAFHAHKNATTHTQTHGHTNSHRDMHTLFKQAHIRNERDCNLIEKELEGKGQNRTRNGIKRIGLFFKILLIDVFEWRTEMFNILPNKHALYLLFTLSHYCSYFINKIILFYLINTFKYH
jgi:hypothetical protein